MPAIGWRLVCCCWRLAAQAAKPRVALFSTPGDMAIYSLDVYSGLSCLRHTLFFVALFGTVPVRAQTHRHRRNRRLSSIPICRSARWECQ